MPDFRRLVGTALIAGVAAGLWLSAARQLWVVPLVLRAETFESATPGHVDAPAHHEWQPAEGLERNGWTWVANTLASFGFALLLVAGFGLRGRSVGWARGLLWGLAGFAVFSLAPAWGLPPALPGTPEAPLAARQAWWLACVAGTAAGLGVLAFVPAWRWRWLGLPLLLLPHVFGAPHVAEPVPPGVAALAHRFIAITLAVNLGGWLVMGGVGGWAWQRVWRPKDPVP